MERIIINDIEFSSFLTQKIGEFPNDYFYTVVDANSFIIMRPLLENIETIEAYSEDGLLIYKTDEYGTYSSIDFQNKDMWSQYLIDGVSVDTFAIRFKRRDLETAIRRIEDKLNDTINEDEMSLDEFKEYWKNKIGKSCTEMIYAGTDIETEYGVEHFTFNDEDQKNLTISFMAAFLSRLPQYYHPSTKPTTSCKPYSYIDIINIHMTLNMNLLYHTTYTNQLYRMIDELDNKEDIRKIVYGSRVDREGSRIISEATDNCQSTIETLSRILGDTNGNSNED